MANGSFNTSGMFLLACKSLIVIAVIIVTFVSTTNSQSARVYRGRSSGTTGSITESTTVLNFREEKTTESSLRHTNTNTKKGKENSSNKNSSKKPYDELQNNSSNKTNKTRMFPNKTDTTSTDTRNNNDSKYGTEWNMPSSTTERNRNTDYTGNGDGSSTNSKDDTAADTNDENDNAISLVGRIGKKEFYYKNENMRFGGAIEFCLTHDMTLAAIESEYENNLMKNFYESVDEHHICGWLGATDGFVKKGEFRWLYSGQPITYSSWESNYPSGDERTSCVNFHNGKWQNWSCDGFGSEDNSSTYMRPICQKVFS